ncbi:MAG: glutamine--fructose-6-phosphate transaminase (isomerizing) [Planctomycetaceae bacterium]|nr:glutamine--fructose-6-phosphate transaminase (isomerizing) [Planctomycetaceae bacterium]
MCGIVGYIGMRPATEFLLEGLRRLEYRGYDSAGVATLNGETNFNVRKTAGRIQRLADELVSRPAGGNIGIGHTRWATHGPPTQVNAHPHKGGAEESVVVVHNGVIENYQEIKGRLESEGFHFQSATDTEVIAHLIDYYLQQELGNPLDVDDNPHHPLVQAVKRAIAELRGTYGLVVMFRDYSDVLIAARLGSPLVLGVGDQEHFIASDASPLAGYTDRIVYLADHQMAVVTAGGIRVAHRDQGQVKHDIRVLDIDTAAVTLEEDCPHFMLKEIYEQPQTLQDAMRGRLCDDDATAKFGGLNLKPQQLRQVSRVLLTACGTSWHSALVGEYLMEEFARLPVEVEYASELRYRNPPVDHDTILFSITQSGETADTLAAQREMKRKGHPTLAICNVVGSTIAQEADGGIYLHAGPEVGVASTKAYTSQLVVLTMLALYFGRLRHLSYGAGRRIIRALHELPDRVAETLETHDRIKEIAAKYHRCDNFLYLGRQYNFPTALEGALKLKEISYIHAEGYPAAEMKHGPIALVDEATPSVFVMPQGLVYEKVMANLEEIKARGGPVIAIAGHGDKQVEKLADDVIEVPDVEDFLQPIATIVPLQLLAYEIALLRGCDVDKPRNLAKSVTVE